MVTTVCKLSRARRCCSTYAALHDGMTRRSSCGCTHNCIMMPQSPHRQFKNWVHAVGRHVYAAQEWLLQIEACLPSPILQQRVSFSFNFRNDKCMKCCGKSQILRQIDGVIGIGRFRQCGALQVSFCAKRVQRRTTMKRQSALSFG